MICILLLFTVSSVHNVGREATFIADPDRCKGVGRKQKSDQIFDFYFSLKPVCKVIANNTMKGLKFSICNSYQTFRTSSRWSSSGSGTLLTPCAANWGIKKITGRPLMMYFIFLRMKRNWITIASRKLDAAKGEKHTKINFQSLSLLTVTLLYTYKEQPAKQYEGWTQTIRTPFLHQTIRTPMLLDDWLNDWCALLATFPPFFLKNRFTCGVSFSFMLRISTTHMGRLDQAEFGWIVSGKLRLQKCV